MKRGKLFLQWSFAINSWFDMSNWDDVADDIFKDIIASTLFVSKCLWEWDKGQPKVTLFAETEDFVVLSDDTLQTVEDVIKIGSAIAQVLSDAFSVHAQFNMQGLSTEGTLQAYTTTCTPSKTAGGLAMSHVADEQNEDITDDSKIYGTDNPLDRYGL